MTTRSEFGFRLNVPTGGAYNQGGQNLMTQRSNASIVISNTNTGTYSTGSIVIGSTGGPISSTFANIISIGSSSGRRVSNSSIAIGNRICNDTGPVSNSVIIGCDSFTTTTTTAIPNSNVSIGNFNAKFITSTLVANPTNNILLGTRITQNTSSYAAGSPSNSILIGSDIINQPVGTVTLIRAISIGKGTSKYFRNINGSVNIGKDTGSGYYANIESQNNIAIGVGSFSSPTGLTTSPAGALSSIIAIGNNALAVSTGFGTTNLIAIGNNAMPMGNTGGVIGDFITAIGNNAGCPQITSQGMAIGGNSFNFGGNQSFAMGYNSMNCSNGVTGASTCDYSVAIGSESLKVFTGMGVINNTTIGYRSGYVSSGNIGSNNVYIGYSAGMSDKTGGTQNVFIGSNRTPLNTGAFIDNTRNCVVLGYAAGLSTGLTGCIAIGAFATGATTNALYVPPNITNLTATALHYNTTTGQIGPNVSSRRFKTNITDSTIDTSGIYDLRPVEFDIGGTRDYGFIAEETDPIAPKLVTYDDNGPYSLRYDMCPFFILQEMKKLRDNNNILSNLNALLETRITSLEGMA